MDVCTTDAVGCGGRAEPLFVRATESHQICDHRWSLLMDLLVSEWGCPSRHRYQLTPEDAVRVQLVPTEGKYRNWRDIQAFSDKLESSPAVLRQLGLARHAPSGGLRFRESGKPLVMPYPHQTDESELPYFFMI
jgi:hypothetical protein